MQRRAPTKYKMIVFWCSVVQRYYQLSGLLHPDALIKHNSQTMQHYWNNCNILRFFCKNWHWAMTQMTSMKIYIGKIHCGPGFKLFCLFVVEGSSLVEGSGAGENVKAWSGKKAERHDLRERKLSGSTTVPAGRVQKVSTLREWEHTQGKAIVKVGINRTHLCKPGCDWLILIFMG